MSSYRLVAYGWGNRGPLTLSSVYSDLDVACEVADRIIADLAIQPHKRPYRIDVVDVWTRETVDRRFPADGFDPFGPDPFAPDQPGRCVGGEATGASDSKPFDKSVLQDPESGAP